MMEVLQAVASNPQLQAEILRGGLRPTGQQTMGPPEPVGGSVVQDAFGHMEPGPAVVGRVPVTQPVAGPTARALGMTPDQAAAMETVAGAAPSTAAQQIGARLTAGPTEGERPVVVGEGAHLVTPQGRSIFENVHRNTPEVQRETARVGALDRQFAEVASRQSQHGDTARSMIIDIGELRTNIQNLPVQGYDAAWRGQAQRLGIDVTGRSQIEVIRSIVNRLAPASRTPGVGPLSDFETRSLLETMPQLVNSRAGNIRILDHLQKMAQARADDGSIADQYLLGGISKEDMQTYSRIGSMSKEKLAELLQRLRGAQAGENQQLMLRQVERRMRQLQ